MALRGTEPPHCFRRSCVSSAELTASPLTDPGSVAQELNVHVSGPKALTPVKPTWAQTSVAVVSCEPVTGAAGVAGALDWNRVSFPVFPY